MTTSKLTLYNGALVQHLGERKLASLSENREPRRVLDDVWDGGFVRWCLEQGMWNFAMRSRRATYSPSVEPAFGYRYAFDRPTDFVRLAAISADERFSMPLLDYRDEGGYWFCDHQTIYVKYVSDDAEFGGDFSLWPETFTRWAQAALAERAAVRLSQNRSDRDAVAKEAKRLLTDARSKDAQNEPTRFPPSGNWSSARRSGSVNREPWRPA